MSQTVINHPFDGPSSRTRSLTKQTITSVKEYAIKEEPNFHYRRTMEDATIAIDNFNGISTDAFFAVYDGHGGRETVNCVLGQLDSIFADHLSKSFDGVEGALRAAFRDMDEKIKEFKLGGGTTAVVCYLQVNEDGKRVLYTANVGDSRAVLVGKQNVMRLSKDHKPFDPEEVAEVVARGGFIGQQGRVNGIILVTRAFGNFDLKPALSCEPYISRVELDDSHKVLVLACDGLWDVCSDEEAMKLVSEVSSSQRMAEHLVCRALKKGSTDNISVVTVLL